MSHTPGPWEVRSVDNIYAVCGPNDWVAAIGLEEDGSLALMDSQAVEIDQANAGAHRVGTGAEGTARRTAGRAGGDGVHSIRARAERDLGHGSCRHRQGEGRASGRST